MLDSVKAELFGHKEAVCKAHRSVVNLMRDEDFAAACGISPYLSEAVPSIWNGDFP